MSGFVGHYRLINADSIDDSNIIKDMTNSISHRGSDSEGFHIDDKIAMGVKRLNTIVAEDVSEPIYNEDNSLVLVFDGLIYNYADLKGELIGKGHIFNTELDSEVVLHGFEEYGTEILNKLRGTFSFAIWSYENERLFCARDLFGVKPFYYYNQEGNFVFGSEIKGILKHPNVKRELNLVALECYLTFQYSVLTETFFKGIYRLPPAHYLIWDRTNLEIKRYWEPIFNVDEDLDSMDEAVEKIESVVSNSVETHKLSGTEIGSFLSSGVDSSYIAACSNINKTFTVGFEHNNYNEVEYAKEFSKYIGVENYNKVINSDEFWDVIPSTQYYMDEPCADPAAVALYFASQVASQHVKVVLSGEGADELFGGYNIYKEPIDLRLFRRFPKCMRNLIGKIGRAIPCNIRGKSFLIRISEDIEEGFIGNSRLFNVEERKELLNNPTNAPLPQELTKPFYDRVKEQHDVTKMQYIDINFWLWGDILLKADRMSMAHSLEVRMPLLDREVFNVASKLPVKYKVNKRGTKRAFRLAAHKYVPEKVAEKKKLGFPVPLRVWLREEKYYNIVKDAFTSDVAKKFFKTDKLVDLLDEHFRGKWDNSRKIWVIYVFIIWYKEYFEKYE